MARAKGLNKATGYINRIFTVEYDLHGMINAYGIDFIHWLADEIAHGRINCKQDVDRWAATVAITKDYTFNAAVLEDHSHNDDNNDIIDIDWSLVA